MKIVKQLVYLLILCNLIFSCNTINTKKNLKEDNQVINLINEVYNTPYPYRNTKLKNEVFTDSLLTLILEARLVEKKSSERIPENQRRNIKPGFLIESEIFASLYEGYTSYSITNILHDNNKYLIDIKFKYEALDIKEEWTDKLIIINENGLKLANVVYNKDKTGVKDLKTFLSSFSEEYYKQL